MKTENQSSNRTNSNTDPLKQDLRIELEQRRPLFPVQNSATSKNEIKRSKWFSRLMIQCDDRGNEPSKNDTTDFEAIDERALPILE